MWRLKKFLISENYEVKTFGSVDEFTGRNMNVTPDIYLFDVMLPDGSGIDLCHEIKQNKCNKDIPLIIMSAHANLSHMKNLCHPDDLISKPFGIENVLKRIQMALN